MNDGALDLPCLTRFHRAQGAKMGAIFVTQWQMQHQILLSPHADTLQLVGKRVAGLRLRRFGLFAA